MKKILLSILALLSFTILVAQKPIIIDGKIDNCKNRDIAQIEKRWFNPETLNEDVKTTHFTIADDGTFHVLISDADNYYHRYWIQLGNEVTHLDLIAGDSLYMTLDANMFDESVVFTGRGAGRNNYQRDDYLEFWERNPVSRINAISNPEQFIEGLNSWTETKLALLNRYYNSGEIDSSYYQFERATILNFKAYQIPIHNSLHNNHGKLPKIVSQKIDSILETIELSDDRFLQFDEYREFLRNYPAYILNNNSKKNGADLRDEITFASAHYTKVAQLYFDKSLINESISNARTLSEKNALLEFFSAQFHEPLLMNEIIILKNRVSLNWLAHSEVFQNTLFATFWLLLLAGVLFLLVKIIQNSKQSSFNLSLWLKVGFYLIVGIVAARFITNSHQPNSIIVVLALLVVFLVHTYFLIPNYAIKRKYTKYSLSLIVASVVFNGGFMLIIQPQHLLKDILVSADILFFIVLLSWISFYIHQLASGKSSLKNLTKSGVLNPELAIHLILVLFINSVFVANVGSDQWSLVLIFYAILILFYLHTFITFPRFLKKDKVAWLIGINVVILLLIGVSSILVDFVPSQQALRNLGIEKTYMELFSWHSMRLDLMLVSLLLLAPSFAYYFIKNQFKKLNTTGFMMYRQKEAELAQLRSQVNPHFLFNTLNTLYAFALKEGSEKTAECIAKLANLMRFMLDDMEKESILLQREISYIEDYVKLQSIRSAVEHEIVITVDMDQEEGYSIAPMLLIPFVENAFKHGMNPNKVSRLKIDIQAKDAKIQFVIENSIDENFEAYYKEKGFGIGIENVKSRLQHIYPNRHNISIAKTNGKFLVILTIDLL